MKQFIVTEINKNNIGEWQTTDSVYYSNDREDFLKKIKRSFQLNGRDYVVREIDQKKILISNRD